MSVYYNEFDPYAAAWLRELIKGGVIAEGIVDERSIEDVRPSDLRGFTQCHFFAGIGIWSVTLRAVGWPDDRRVWTGSCPCQPFSAAGKRKGTSDERHLWPSWYWLISECSKAFGDIGTIFGEQVASKDGVAWLDTVQSDLEGIGYAVGATDIPAASVGAPHIRQRLYFVAESQRDGRRQSWNHQQLPKQISAGRQNEQLPVEISGSSSRLAVADNLTRRFADATRRNNVAEISRSGAVGELAIATGIGRGRRRDGDPRGNGGEVQTSGRSSSIELGNAERSRHDQPCSGSSVASRDGTQSRIPDRADKPCILGNADDPRLQGFGRYERDGYESRRLDSQSARSIAATGAVSGSWADADWLYCRDEKFRPVERGTFPLAHGIPRDTRSIVARLCELGIDPDDSKRIVKLARANRTGRLRGYGNAIVEPQAVAFIESYLETF